MEKAFALLASGTTTGAIEIVSRTHITFHRGQTVLANSSRACYSPAPCLTNSPTTSSSASTTRTSRGSTAVHRDPANAGRRFIPLLLGECVSFPRSKLRLGKHLLAKLRFVAASAVESFSDKCT
jgi:hypothetical protein